MPDTPKAALSIVVDSSVALPRPEGANYFHFTMIGTDVQFLVGAINLLQAYERKGKRDDTPIAPEITHRFLLSPYGFLALKAQVDEIFKLMPTSENPFSHEAKE